MDTPKRAYSSASSPERKLTPRETKTLDFMRLDGLALKEAMLKAGYADPDTEVPRFLARPAVQRAMALGLVQDGQLKVTWAAGVEAALGALYRIIVDPHAKDSDIIAASKGLLDTVRQIGMRSLFEKAREEDKAKNASMEELADHVIGAPTAADPLKMVDSLPAILMDPPEGKPN